MGVELGTGAGGLPRLRLTHPSGSAAEVYQHGAHLTSWVPAGGEDAIFLSERAEFGPKASIRGGIPVIFPQFAELGPLPKHGFARRMPWEWERAFSGEPGTVAARLRLRDTPDTRAVWPHAFLAELTVTLYERALGVELAVRNPGDSPFSFTTALHSYLRVAEIGEAALEGLDGAHFLDRVPGEPDGMQQEEELRITGETDRVYPDAPRELRLHDRAAGRTLEIGLEGFQDVVVWNPGAEKAREIGDLGDEEYRRMLCVEPAQVERPVRLASGEEWRGALRLQA